MILKKGDDVCVVKSLVCDGEEMKYTRGKICGIINKDTVLMRYYAYLIINPNKIKKIEKGAK